MSAKNGEVTSKLQTITAHSEGVHAVKIGPISGQIIATGGQDNKVNLWRIGKPSCLISIRGAKHPVKSLCFDPEEKVIASGSESGSIHLFALNAEGKTRCRLSAHRAECSALSFHPLGNMIASGSVDSNVKLWDIRSKSSVRTFMGHSDTVTSMEFSPDGRWVVSGSADKTVRLWDLQTGKELQEFSNHRSGITSVKFHPGEFWLASSSLDGTVKYFDLETFRLVGSTPAERGSAVKSITFLGQTGRNPVEERKFKHSLVAATDNGVKVWRWQPCRCIGSETSGWGPIADSQISKDKYGDHQLVSCTFKESSMVSIWSVNLSALTRGQSLDHDDEEEEESGSFNVMESHRVQHSPVNNRAERSTEENESKTASYPSPLQSGSAQSRMTEGMLSSEAGENNGNEEKQNTTHDGCDDGTATDDDYENDFEEDNEDEVDEALQERSQRPKQRDSTISCDNQNAEEKCCIEEKLPTKKKSSVSKLESTGAGQNPNSNEKNDGVLNRRSSRRSSRTPIPARSEKVDFDACERKASVDDSCEKEDSKKAGKAALIRPRSVVGSLAAQNCPLDVSISEFMLRPNSGIIKSKTIRAEMKTSVAEDVLTGHAKFQTVLQDRFEELEHVLGMWNDGETISTLEYIDHLANPSVSYDLLKFANLRNGQVANLDICAAALPSLIALADSPFEDYIKLALATSKFLFDSFSEIVFSTLDFHYRNKGSNSARGSVDVSREERVTKCLRCFSGFKDLSFAIAKLVDSPAIANVARTKRDAANLQAKLEKFSGRLHDLVG